MSPARYSGGGQRLEAGLVAVPGHPPFSLVAHDPDGFAKVVAIATVEAGVAARNELTAAPIAPAHVAMLEARVLAMRHAKQYSGRLNELRITAITASRSSAARSLVVHAALSDFAAHVAAREFVAAASYSSKHLWYSAGICPPLSHGLATSLVVVTSDLQMLVARRAASMLAGGTWDAGIGEGQSVNDLHVDADGRLVWDPYRTARRGLREELGVTRVQYLGFHSLIVNLVDGSTSLVGLAFLPISAEALAAQLTRGVTLPGSPASGTSGRVGGSRSAPSSTTSTSCHGPPPRLRPWSALGPSPRGRSAS